MRRIQLMSLAALVAVGILYAKGAHALGVGEMFGFDPFARQQTLETPHFRITHSAANAELANLAARHLEDAHRVLTPVMKWDPPYRTQVVILDNSDFANGLAGAAGRLGMVLWTTPPDNWLSIAHYDDWFRMLCFHEYTHILNLDITRDFYRILRIFLGDSIRPNTLWQSWMLEGLATSQETSFTRAGRGRSSYYGMLRRGVWRGGMLKPVAEGGRGIGQITGTRTIPPLGEVAYFFGHELMNEFSGGDPSRLGALSYEAASTLPFLYNRNATEVSGRDWPSYWDSWSAKAARRAEQEVAAIEAAGKTEPEWITRGNLNSYRPAVSSDGRWMAYGRELYDEQPILAIRDLQATDPRRAERRLIENIGGGSVAFTASGDAVIFSTVEREGLYRFFSQLWVHDLASGKSYPLGLPAGVQSLRAKDPDIRGDRIVFTVATPGRVGVAMGRLLKVDGRYELQEIQKVFEPKLLGRAATPRISPDGRQVVFSLHVNAETEERLVVMQVGQGQVGQSASRVLITGLAGVSGGFDRFPTWLDSKTLIFSSNRSGVDNLYRFALDSKSPATAITNVESGAWFTEVTSLGRMVATVYTPTGWDVAWIRPAASNPPTIGTEPFFQAQGTERVTPAAALTREEGWKLAPYSIYPSILPRGWAPLIQSSLSGGIEAAAMLAGFDALDLHRYLLSVGYDSGLSVPEGSVEYSNRRLGAVWSVAGTSKIQAIGETTYQREDSFGTSISLYRPFTEAVLNPSLEWTWERVRLHSRSSGAVLDRVQDLPQLRVKVDFNDTDSSRQAIMPEEGWAGTLGHQWSLAPERTGHELIWNQGHFFHLGGHRVLWPRWQLALSDGRSVQVEGRRNQLLEAFSNSDFDQLVLRGYPLRIFTGLQAAAVGSLDLRFPLLRVEQGWSNRPIFFEVLHGLVFVDTAALASPGLPVSRPSSWGLGVRGDWEILNVVPLITALEYHQGFDTTSGGRSELFFQFKLGGISF